MSIGTERTETAAATVRTGSADVTAAARDLITGLVAEPWGQVSPSIYETGRLVSLTPWLTGHDRRVDFLTETQRPDGGWGAPDDGYALVPTLSATEALLSVLVRSDASEPDGPTARAARGGLDRLHVLLPGGRGPELPDMPAIELIVPSLVELINKHLGALAARSSRRVPLPEGMDGAKLTVIRRLLTSGIEPPQKLMHALEVAGEVARGLPQAHPEPTGTIGASPAATAAWLGDRPPSDPSAPARWYLETVAATHGGPVPVGFPLTVFERGWVLAWLERAGVPFVAPPELVLSLTAPLRADGTPAAAGLPADADTTAGALYALALLGAPHRPDPLWEYETSTHFCTWQGEDGYSLTTNAHVLEAFGEYLASVGTNRLGADAAGRYADTIDKVSGWLCQQQQADGSWTDRWHASPYYATACCALALDRFGGERCAPAVERARQWVLGRQRPDGSWGRWHGTAEETAYAVQVLLLPRPGRDEPRARAEARFAAASAARTVLEHDLGRPTADRSCDPPLWHDKDLYHPTAIVRAAVIAALHLISSRRPPRPGK
ncbi:prenyltransferase/squalene oxidase repeat-containing protein [Actinomadura xylanilytica]|uniref:prenyltransferase/squalene oxidase repeat-containing protein n=1 Tax=Actinomadura xylanilytica TaxID=887459 RepID=UPI00255A711F|nr:prenyltransferase/squalene oxidase repeat-containing protein [Actinomadura xylanilytica]MDL4777642.1 prenyltransferase/squalene oxidase repeat-containing protein [Actinomadura xylanilytica]